MKMLSQTYAAALALVLLNMDRFLSPLLILAALTLAGWLLSYATVH